MERVPAHLIDLEALTDAYNQTRLDYIVPMPMSVARLKAYIHTYDVDLASSCVLVDNAIIQGLGLLGLRTHRAWITRLGVLASGRKRGMGRSLMEGLISAATRKNVDTIWLEVIKGNTPAHTLFRRFGFEETRELLIVRRPPGPLPDRPGNHAEVRRVTTLDHESAIILLSHRRAHANWLNQTESMENVRNLSGLQIELTDGSRGWVTYHASLMQLSRIMVEVVTGNPEVVTTAVLRTLHQRYPNQDAVIENIPQDANWPGYEALGYFDTFRRIEMRRDLEP